jgi:signal peptidase I
MVRNLVRAAAVVVIVIATLVVLGYSELLVWPQQHRGAMVSTIGCDARTVAEGLTYRIRDPRQGEVVAIHAARDPQNEIVPDRDARDLTLVLRVAGTPGDQVVGRDGAVFVNGVKFDDIRTKPFKTVDLGGDQYFVLGDNRSGAIDSRTFGPILKNTMYARVFFVVWPPRDIGGVGDRDSGAPAGPLACA